MKIPKFEHAPEYIKQEYNYRIPVCCGTWIKGSGGHRIHGNDCNKEATWYHPSDIHQYCEEHIPEFDKEFYLQEWMNYLMNIEELKQIISTIPEDDGPAIHTGVVLIHKTIENKNNTEEQKLPQNILEELKKQITLFMSVDDRSLEEKIIEQVKKIRPTRYR